MADWPSAFSSATTSLPRPGCVSAFESWLRGSEGCTRTSALTRIALRAEHDGPRRPCGGPGGSGIEAGLRTGPILADSARVGEWSKYESAELADLLQKGPMREQICAVGVPT